MKIGRIFCVLSAAISRSYAAKSYTPFFFSIPPQEKSMRTQRNPAPANCAISPGLGSVKWMLTPSASGTAGADSGNCFLFCPSARSPQRNTEIRQDKNNQALTRQRSIVANLQNTLDRLILSNIISAFAAGFGFQADVGDDGGFVHSLDHVVERQGGDGDGSQRLHLDAGLAGDMYLGFDLHAGI